jgi:hypothetical protein
MALVVIGNVHHVLPRQWREFHARAFAEIEASGAEVAAEWFTEPLSLHENASWLIEIQPGIVARLKEVLAEVGRDYGTNAIAWYDVCRNEYVS